MTAFVPNEGVPAPGILTDPPATQSSLEHRDDSPGSGAGIQPDITSRRDEFSYRVPRVTSYRGSGLYWWQNSGITAQVQQASAVSAGGMRLVIRDANGAEVFSRLARRGREFSDAKRRLRPLDHPGHLRRRERHGQLPRAPEGLSRRPVNIPSALADRTSLEGSNRALLENVRTNGPLARAAQHAAPTALVAIAALTGCAAVAPRGPVAATAPATAKATTPADQASPPICYECFWKYQPKDFHAELTGVVREPSVEGPAAGCRPPLPAGPHQERSGDAGRGAAGIPRPASQGDQPAAAADDRRGARLHRRRMRRTTS